MINVSKFLFFCTLFSIFVNFTCEKSKGDDVQYCELIIENCKAQTGTMDDNCSKQYNACLASYSTKDKNEKEGPDEPKE